MKLKLKIKLKPINQQLLRKGLIKSISFQRGQLRKREQKQLLISEMKAVITKDTMEIKKDNQEVVNKAVLTNSIIQIK